MKNEVLYTKALEEVDRFQAWEFFCLTDNGPEEGWLEAAVAAGGWVPVVDRKVLLVALAFELGGIVEPAGFDRWELEDGLIFRQLGEPTINRWDVCWRLNSGHPGWDGDCLSADE